MSNILKTLAAGSASEPTDEYFNQTTLLLHGDGTNGAQNNTFLDSSTNNFTITRNGNTTQGTFSPFSSEAGKWSNYFQNAVADYLTTPSNAAFGMGTGEWTIEGWFYTIRALESFNVSWHIGAINAVDGMAGSVATTSVGFRSNGQTDISSSVSIANQWTHIAWVKSGNTVTIYVNGTSVTSGTYTNSIATGVMTIGYNATQFRFGGYISNLRVIKGTAVYTSTFTPPTAPLTAISGTSLLTCQSNRFVDNSSNAFAITPAGNTSVQPFSPFAPSAAYDPSVNGGSGYFDGSGDLLSIPSALSTFQGLGANDFSYECFVYPLKQTNTYSQGLISYGQAGSTGGNTCDLAINASGYFQIAYATGAAPTLLSPSLATVNAWTHIVVCRTGSTLSMFVNGTRVATASTSATVGSGGTVVYIGNQWYAIEAARQLQGYISNARVLIGSSAYDATQTTLTVPTAPPSPTGSSLCLLMQNAGIFDNTGKNVLETVGNAQVDTSVVKYGTGSMEFDGTDDRLVIPASPNIAFGTGDFTIEAWVNSDNVGTYGLGWLQISGTTGGLSTTYTGGIAIYFGNPGAGAVRVLINGTGFATSAGVVSAGTYHHFALTRQSGTCTIWINGVSSATTTNTSNLTAQNVCIGGYYSTSYLYDGYLDDLRITKGVARYAANFTPPDKAFPNQ